MIERQTYSVTEAARILGVGKVTLYKAIREGNIEALRIGAKPRIVVPKYVIERMLKNPSGISDKSCGHTTPHVWKYDEYSDWSRQLAKDYTPEELTSMLHQTEYALKRAAKSHLSAIGRSVSMTGNSQHRAQSRNSVTGASARRTALKDALEIYQFYPEHTKLGASK